MTSPLPPEVAARHRARPAAIARLLEPGANLWLSNELSLVGWGETWRYRPAASSDFALSHADAAWALIASRAAVTDPLGLPGTGLVAFASFGFSPRTQPILTVPRFLVGFTPDAAWLTVAYQADAPSPALAAALQEDAYRVLSATPPTHLPWARALPAEPAEIGEARHAGIVAGVTARLQAGEAQKVVLAREVVRKLDAGDTPAVAAALAARLREAYPECWTFSVGALVGATPEMLVETRAGRAHCRVLAGTYPAGQTASLLDSPKDMEEHEIAVETVQTALETCAADVTRARGPYLLELPNVTHLATDVTARVEPGTSLLLLAAAIHPTGAVCGKPREVAAGIIEQVENLDRGRYAGPVGWVDGNGGGQLGLALRCAQIEPGFAPRVHVYGGGGIMPKSDPGTEVEETNAKMRPVLEALEP